ncbi:hypothetical protein FRC03_002538 [Tulasnella sp. 419]|nr:hypothetical protein FRC03_002538 [Tulasnella sp. 419]
MSLGPPSMYHPTKTSKTPPITPETMYVFGDITNDCQPEKSDPGGTFPVDDCHRAARLPV